MPRRKKKVETPVEEIKDTKIEEIADKTIEEIEEEGIGQVFVDEEGNIFDVDANFEFNNNKGDDEDE